MAEKISLFPLGRRLAQHARRRARVYETLESFITALVVFILLQAFVVQAYEIPSGSMEDTLLVGDRILVSKFYYWFEPPDYGDIVVFQVPDVLLQSDPDKRYYIKRLVGKPGDVVEVREGRIFVNDRPLDRVPFFHVNTYTNEVDGKFFTRERVPEGMYYVFGDHSRVSLDSRKWGGVPEKNVVGKAVFRFWPLSRIGLIVDRVSPDRPHVQRPGIRAFDRPPPRTHEQD
ncbi:signal peptidase I [bacterium]|nr:signal peptidase I [bacterium]